MRLIAWALVLTMVLLAGCSGTGPLPRPQTGPIPETRPEDFTLAVTVLGPGRGPSPVVKGGDGKGDEEVAAPQLPRSLRPGRYIVEADGALRAALGPGAEATTFPAQTRQLSPRQVDLLWRLVRDSGLLDATNPGRIEGPDEALRSPDRTTALFYVAYAGQRVTVRTLLDRSGEDALAAERVVDRLAEWAWVR
jgi:hypothetical protein